MSRLRRRWREPSFILDVAQVIVAIVVGIVLALDMTGIWAGIPWLSQNLASLTFIAVCILIVSAFLERRVQAERFAETAIQKLDKIIESTPSGIRLENRQGFKVPLEIRLLDAQDVSLLGSSLAGIVTHYEGLLTARAKAGCKFRLLITDPRFYESSVVPGNPRRKMYIEHTISILEPLLRKTENIQLKYISYRPPFLLLLIDPDKPYGEVQVELFAYQTSASDRPHFVLSQSTDKKWYDFFRGQFELAWQEARPHVLHSETSESRPDGGVSGRGGEQEASQQTRRPPRAVHQ
jgi:hypothetical protein